MAESGNHFLDGSRRLWRKHQKLRYLAVGAWNTAAGYGIFAGLYLMLGQTIGYIVIAIISHLLAVTQSFATQRWIVFRSSGNSLAEYLRFHIAHLGSLGISLSALPLLVEVLGMSPLLAQGLVTAMIVIASYFVHQHFTFRKAKDAQ